MNICRDGNNATFEHQPGWKFSSSFLLLLSRGHRTDEGGMDGARPSMPARTLLRD
jgi:hypothetical protein